MLVLLLMAGAGFLHGVGLGAMEFFRHTEADRSLIAWEMVQRGQYLIPHLLGSAILTKPPVFYWCIAACYKLFGCYDEWVSRIPSVISVMLICGAQYLFTSRATGSRRFGVLSSCFLVTCAMVFTLAPVAEIDMLYGFICTLSLYPIYFSLWKKNPLTTIAAYAAAAAAFLIKGPPVVFFFAATFVSFGVWRLWRLGLREGLRGYRGELAAHLIGELLFCLAVGIWLSFLIHAVGWGEVLRQFRVEVIDRVIAPARQPRGPLFYPLELSAGLLPWVLFPLGVLIKALRSVGRQSLKEWYRARTDQPFLIFSALAVGTALFMLSIAQSKSSRYIFPIYPFAANLCVYSLLALDAPMAREKFFAALERTALLLFAAVSAGILVIVARRVPGITAGNAFLSWITIAAALAYFKASVRTRVGTQVMIGALLLVFAVKMSLLLMFVPYRNAEKGVKPIAAEIAQIVPAGEPIYTIEMFERWIVYYLKRTGRETYRVTRENMDHPVSVNGRVYLLLNRDEEWWRVAQLELHDPSARVAKIFDTGPDSPFILEVDKKTLPFIRPLDYFPTFPTKPYYTPEEKRALGLSPN